MAIRRFNNTITLITEYEPNIKSPQNLVYVLIPVNSKLDKSTKPKLAQNKDCDDSKTLRYFNKFKEIKIKAIT